MAKTLEYSVAGVPDRLTGGVNYVPYLRDRGDALPLEEVVRRAIDHGRIAGLKTSAAKAVADGVATQMREEFLDGNTVNFGAYFYARPYLTGRTDENGKLDDERNGVAVRIFKGRNFKMKLSDFNLKFIGDTAPTVDFVIADAPSAVKGEMQKGKGLFVFGNDLVFDPAMGDAAVIAFDASADGAWDTETAVDVAYSGPNLLRVEWSNYLDAVEAGTPCRLQLDLHTDSGAQFELRIPFTMVAAR